MSDLFNKKKFDLQLYPVFFFLICLLFLQESSAQESEQLQTRLSLNCIQQVDEMITVVAKLRYRKDRQYFNLSGQQLIFYAAASDGQIEFGKAITNDEGESNIILKSSDLTYVDVDSFYSISVEYAGNDEFKSSEQDLQFKKAKLIVTSEMVDSIPLLKIQAIALNGFDTPLPEQEVYILVPRMFSELTVFNDYSDEEGYLEMDFPTDLPGGSTGELEVIVRIPDTDEYGTLEAQLSTDWGVPNISSNEVQSRELWSPDPPIWMLVTFAILMALVWGHYLIIVYKLYLIKKEENNLKITLRD